MAENELEVRLRVLKEDIITKLRDGSQYQVIRVVSNEDEGGSEALMLHTDGSWSVKFDMSGYPLGNDPSINDLLYQYASVKDKAFRNLMISDRKSRLQNIKNKDGHIAVLNQYVEQHRNELLQGLIAAMQDVLRQLSE